MATGECAAHPATPTAPADPRAAAFAGAWSGVIATIWTHPLDLVRTKLAVQRSRPGKKCKYVGTAGTLRTVYKEEGFAGLFQGVMPAVVGLTPSLALFFSQYNLIKALVVKREATEAHKELLRWSNATFGARFTSFVLTPEFIEPALAAGGAWVSTCILTNPLWVVKIKQQTQPLRNNKRKYRGIIGSLRTILREEGVRGWYTGTATSCAGFPGAMLHMPLYEALKRTDDGLQPSAVRVSAAGATSGAFVTTLTYPIEVVRMRLQAQGSRRQGDETRTRYSGALDAFRKILSSEGITSFYRGLGTSLARTVPNSAIALCSYELILRIASTLLANITDPDSMKHQ